MIGPVLGVTIILCGLSAAPAADRPAVAILAEINIPFPKRPADATDKAAVQGYKARTDEWYKRRSDLIGELYATHPEAPELAELLPWRWVYLVGPAAANEAIRAEIRSVFEQSNRENFHASAYWGLAMLADQEASKKETYRLEEVMPFVDDFCRRYPQDQRGSRLLRSVARRVKDRDEQEKLWARVLKEYPEPGTAVVVERGRKQAEDLRKQLDRVGQPFPLEFVDAIKGKRVSMESLKGKVVVVDFWGTWCGPCVAEMPRMKKLYAEYKDKGVEFIGVSVERADAEAGLAALKDYVAKNGVEWPQFYQEKSSESEFVSNWGITSIPQVFLVDAQGRLASVEARGKLEILIPKYLDEARAIDAKPAP